MLEDKDNELNNVNSILDESRVTYESTQSESSVYVDKINQDLQDKTKEIMTLEEIQSKLEAQLRDKST